MYGYKFHLQALHHSSALQYLVQEHQHEAAEPDEHDTTMEANRFPLATFGLSLSVLPQRYPVRVEPLQNETQQLPEGIHL
jgi:hypothetical protein